MSETENNTQGQKPRISKLSIWTAIIVGIVGVVIALSIPVEKLVIFGAIFVPVIFFGGILVRIILIFKNKQKAR